MKRLTRSIASLSALVLTTATVLLLTTAGAAPAPMSSPALPVLNENVLAFARAKVGTSVGDGVCTSLAIAALKEAGARCYPMAGNDGDFTWGEPVESFKEALPGDILQFHNAVLKGNKPLSRGRWTSWHYEFPHHTAIVSRVSAGGKLVSILHQNVTLHGKDTKDTKRVQETQLPIDSLHKGGWIRIFRPVAAFGRGLQRDDPADADPQP
jgi:hypothetical protein